MSTRNDNPSTCIPIPDGEHAYWIGWPALIERLQRAITDRCSSKPVLVVECYPGVHAEVILQELQQRLQPTLAFNTSTVFHPPQRIEKLTQPYVNESPSRVAPNHALTLPEFFDAERLWHARREIEDLRQGLVVIVGCGASLIAWGHVLIYADLTRTEARQRLSDHGSNLGVENQNLGAERKLHIASQVDWSVADRWKRPLLTHWDFVLEMKPMDAPRLIDGEAMQRGLQLAVQRPFCFAPSRSHDLTTESHVAKDSSQADSAWHQENLRLSFGAVPIEFPALDLLLAHPRALLGDAAFLRFRFDCPLPLISVDQVMSFTPVSSGEGWRAERAIFPEASPIDLCRLQFARGMTQHTKGRIAVLRLTESARVSVESPSGAFAPLVFQRGQTFIMPAAVGEFMLRPNGLSDGSHVILMASLRT